MAKLIVETIADSASGHVFAQIRDAKSDRLLAQSAPIYASHEEAEERIIDTIAKAWPTTPADPVYPANGS